MRAKTRVMAIAGFASLALVLSACGGGGGSQDNPAGPGKSDNAITIRGCTPQNALIPGSTSEVCGGNVLDAVMAKLVHYNADTAAPEMDLAQSIETTDNTNFTVKLEQGRKFHDGTEVKAKNFVDAWNYTAYFPNGQPQSYFFGPIEGYGDLQPADAAGKDKPKTDKLSGLKVVDDYTFTIKTAAEVSNLPVRLGYTAFSPLPDSFFTDPKAFEDKPIGAGPFKFDSQDAQKIVLSKFADYSGKFKPNVDKVTFRIYNDDSAAYNDTVANQLDFTDIIPPNLLVGDAWKTDLDGRNANPQVGIIQTLAFSDDDPQLKKNPDLRKAISRAINREQITKVIFNGTRTPATSWVSPVVDGYKAGVCGDPCIYDKAAAKAAYDKAGGYKGTIRLSVNGDGGHKDWSEATCNSIKDALGLDCQVNLTPDFKTLRNQIQGGELKGMFRSGWQMDYPSIENFLAPIYAKGADSNDTNYDNPAFDKKLAEAAAAKTPDESNTLYQEAEGILAADFPVAPLWSQTIPVGWSNKVTDVKVTPFSTLDLTSIKVK